MKINHLIIAVTLLFTFLAVPALSDIYTVQCQTSQSCSTGLQATYKSASGKTATSCVSTSGNIGCPTLQTEFDVISNCSKDEFGQVCPDSICIKRIPLQHCVMELESTDPCPEATVDRTDKATCGKCKDTPGCKSQNCITVEATTNLEACFSETECPLTNFEITYGKCTNDIDSYGATCQCCAKTSDNVRASQCSNLVPLFSTSQFKQLKNREEGNESWETEATKVWIFALCLFAMLWY